MCIRDRVGSSTDKYLWILSRTPQLPEEIKKKLVTAAEDVYKRQFLSSGVVRNPDYTMERLVRVAKDLRQVYRFNGYIPVSYTHLDVYKRQV